MKQEKLKPSHAASPPARQRDEILLALGMQLNVLLSSARAFTAETAANFEPELSGVSFQILQRLHAVGATRSTRIAEALAMDRSALSRVLQQLTQSGLVEAYADPLDGRATVYALTNDAGKKMDCSIAEKGSRFSQRMQDWTDVEIQQLSELLRRLNGATLE